jgi:DTW domain-containing protein YfiP
MQTCVCSALGKVENNIRILILQDKNELKNAKNTARLLALSLSNIEMIQSDDTKQMQALGALCINEPSSIALVFPSNNSKGFETEFQHKSKGLSNTNQTIRNLLFIDGTWRKAKRLYLSHEWLQNIPSFHFEQELQGKYRIRKTSIDNGLSTVEAVAYALAKTEDVSVKPLYEVFEKMQSYWPHN